MLPPRQHFEADDTACRELDLGLVDRDELGFRDTCAQAGLGFAAGTRDLVHSGVKPGYAPLILLAGVHRQVRLPEQSADIGTGGLERGHADRGTDACSHSGYLERLLQPFRDPRCQCSEAAGLVFVKGQSEREFVAAEPGTDRRLGRDFQNRLGDSTEQLVAEFMAMRVIYAAKAL